MRDATFVSCAVLLCTPTAWAQLRCGNTLVHEGERPAQVLLKCGEPLVREYHYECVPFEMVCPGVEKWTYDLGPQKMLRLLTFRGGRLREIELIERP